MPNEQWDDFALSQQFTALDRRLETHDHALEGLSHFPIDVAKAALEIEHLAREVQNVQRTCEVIRDEWRQSVQGRQKGRTAVVVAIITGCFTILAALVVLVAQLAGAG